MIELILIAGGSLLTAIFCVWLYRRITEMKGKSFSLVSLSENTGSLRISHQQGFVHIKRPAHTRRVGLATTYVSRKPWGW